METHKTLQKLVALMICLYYKAHKKKKIHGIWKNLPFA